MKSSYFVKFLLIILFFSCRKIDVVPSPIPKQTYIFDNKQIDVKNGDSYEYVLDKPGRYTLTMVDSISNQVVSREKIVGKTGINKLTIYTKTLQSKYLYLVLRDSVESVIGKTILLIN